MKRLAIVLLVLSGCGKDENISHYRVPKDPAWRMLAAIIPGTEATWFLKVTGASPRLKAVKDPFLRFVDSVRFEEKKLAWTLPDGWKQDAEMVVRVGTEEPPLLLAVTSLAGPAGGILGNVNRWRGQLGLGPVDESSLPSCTERRKAGELQITVVDIEGPNQPSAMTGNSTQPPPQHPEHQEAPEFLFDLPKGWTKAEPPSAMCLVEVFTDGEKPARITLTQFPGDVGGLVANVNRWRGQVGLPPVDQEGVQKLVSPQPFLGAEGSRVDAAGSEQALVVVFKLGGPHSTFLKMQGETAAVERAKPAFEAFLKSLKGHE